MTYWFLIIIERATINNDIVHVQSKFDAHQRRASITYQLTSPRAKAMVIN